jgi:hypothetical protein
LHSAASLSSALVDAKELLLSAYWNNNIEVAEFNDGHIKFYDRKNDADFVQRLQKFLLEKTGKNWVLEKLERAETAAPIQTAAEAKKAEMESDPMIANALDLFAGAEIVGTK